MNIWDKFKAVPELIMAALLRTQREDNQVIHPTLARRHVVIPKEFINTMPIWWQADFRRLTETLSTSSGYDALAHDFHIYRRDHQGRFEDFPDSKSMGMTSEEATDMADKLF